MPSSQSAIPQIFSRNARNISSQASETDLEASITLNIETSELLDTLLSAREDPKPHGLENIELLDADEYQHDISNSLAVGTRTRLRIVKVSRDDGTSEFFSLHTFFLHCVRDSPPEKPYIACRVFEIESPVETLKSILLPWSSNSPIEQLQQVSEIPRTHELADAILPKQLGHLTVLKKPLRSSRELDMFVCKSARYISLTLASESRHTAGSSNDSVALRGVVSREIEIEKEISKISKETAWSIHKAVCFAYSSLRESEIRHQILVNELARCWPPGETWYRGLSVVLNEAMECTHRAYATHLHEASLEAQRSMADLRKALTEESGRIIAMTSTMISSLWKSFVLVAGAIAAGVLKPDETSGEWLTIIAVVLIVTMFVGQLLVNLRSIGNSTKSLQEWKSRIYFAVSESDFSELMEKPIRRERRTHTTVAVLVGTLNLLLIWAAFMYPTEKRESAKPNDEERDVEPVSSNFTTSRWVQKFNQHPEMLQAATCSFSCDPHPTHGNSDLPPIFCTTLYVRAAAFLCPIRGLRSVAEQASDGVIRVSGAGGRYPSDECGLAVL